jgi:hypothetical protein
MGLYLLNASKIEYEVEAYTRNEQFRKHLYERQDSFCPEMGEILEVLVLILVLEVGSVENREKKIIKFTRLKKKKKNKEKVENEVCFVV